MRSTVSVGGVKLPKAAVDAITLRVSGADYEVTVVGYRRQSDSTPATPERK